MLETIGDIQVPKEPSTDTRWWDTLDSTYRTRVYKYAHRVTNCVDDAADVAQEALVRFYQALTERCETLNSQTPIMRWLARTCTNIWIDRIRKRHDEQPLPETLDPRSLANPDRWADAWLLEMHYSECADKLAPREREHLVKANQGWTVRELAAQTGIPRNNISRNILESRKRILECLRGQAWTAEEIRSIVTRT